MPAKPLAAKAPAVPDEVAVPPAPAGPQLTREDLEAWLDGFIPFALARGNIAGGIIVVVKDGEVLLQKGFGYADVEKKKPVDPQDVLLPPGLGLEALHLDGGHAAGRPRQARPRYRR